VIEIFKHGDIVKQKWKSEIGLATTRRESQEKTQSLSALSASIQFRMILKQRTHLKIMAHPLNQRYQAIFD
jgi:hypothetical protein